MGGMAAEKGHLPARRGLARVTWPTTFHPLLPRGLLPGVAGEVSQPLPQPGMGGLQSSGRAGQAGHVLPSPTLASPPSGRLLPAASGSPGRGCRRRQRPPPDAGPACPSHCQVFTCSVCQETFRRRMELRVHMVSHTGEMPYKVRLGLCPGQWAEGQPQDPSCQAPYMG